MRRAVAGKVAGTIALLLGVALGAPGQLEGQVTGDTVRVDTVVVADSVARDSMQVDTTRARVLERLQSLARLPGEDSILFVRDSLEVAAEALAGGSVSSLDSISLALSALPGYTLTEYHAESAQFAAEERVLTLQAPDGGRARILSEGSVLEADTSITFDEPAGSMSTVGLATFTPPDGEAVDAARMIYSLEQSRGTADEAETMFAQQGANWRVNGEMPFASPDSTFMAHAQFTSCDIEDAHYHFETGEIKIVNGHWMVAKDVTLYFADVPVAWLPFMAQSLSRGRSSGLLTPRFSVNDIVRTSGGYRRRVSNVGFYWAINDHFDALTAMDWFSETFLALTGSFRYNFPRQFLQGDVAVRRYWNADGSGEFGVDTRHGWDIDERTRLSVSGRFITDTDFVRENSFDPREVTGSIDSDAGLNRRFDWGSLSFSASRKEYLSDDRVEWLLPSVNLSLSPITLFRAPSSEAGVFNNMTWSGSGSFRRNASDRVQPDTIRSLSVLDIETAGADARSTLSIGRLSFTQSAGLTERRTIDVPEALLVLGDSAPATQLISGAPVRSLAEADLDWSLGVGYQQQLIGSTTLTPRLSLSGNLFRSDTDSLAANFVSAPSRMSLGAQLKTDIYGFWPGVGPFEAIRHKLSPAFDYQWSPESTPTSLQEAVFGARVLQPKNSLSISLTQTFEAKRRPDETSDTIAAPAQLGPDGLPVVPDSVDAADQAAEALPAEADGGPRRLLTTPSTTLLAWRMSVVRYDFVEADEVGVFLAGFETTRLENQFSSDYLRGMTVSMAHELFVDEPDETGRVVGRTFEPHLSSLNLGFSVGSTSSIFRWLTFWRDDGPLEAPAEEPDATAPVDFGDATREGQIMPVRNEAAIPQQPSARSGATGGWNANVSYSLQRPRIPGASILSEMLSGTLRLQPTENWSVSWRTAYDLDRGAFNDHAIRLTRDLHRWQANFDFLQTATGNWTFSFEVALLDNRDLKFDYRQRNLDLGVPTR